MPFEALFRVRIECGGFCDLLPIAPALFYVLYVLLSLVIECLGISIVWDVTCSGHHPLVVMLSVSMAG